MLNNRDLNFMNKLILLASATFLSSATLAADWGYQQETAPEHWADLKKEYQSCSGQNQSPINIDQTTKAVLAPLKFDYKATSESIINNGHTVQVNFKAGNSLELDDQKFELKQFHLHSPSENTIKGKQYPMELHLVHANTKGELAVVAIMYDAGNENKTLNALWNELPKEAGATVTLKHTDLAETFLPKALDYYRFNGSLTTPPCSEGVRWVVLKEIQQASTEQIKAFSALMEHHGGVNNRPVQPQNARLVLE